MAKTQKNKTATGSKQNKENAGVATKKIAKKPKGLKVDGIKNKKPQVLKEAVKEAKVQLKKGKYATLADKKLNGVNSKQANGSNKKPCLVLAPPESPVPIAKPAKALKKAVKTAVEKNPSVAKGVGVASSVKPGKKLNKNAKQLAAKAARGKKEENKQKPKKKLFEALPFEDKKFDAIVNVENVAKVAKAIKELVEKEVATKKTSIFGDYNYCLNVASFKIPSCPKRMVKLNLKHSLVDLTNDDVVIVVPDLKRGAKVEYESTIEHYTDLFREAGLENLKIMPFNQLRNEFKTFESKRKLGSTYDFYLCDGRIVGQVVGFCGSLFQKPRTTFHSVRLENKNNVKSEIEKSLRRTAYKQLSKGDLITIPIGNDRFEPEEIANNVVHIVSQLKDNFPGGLDNIRAMDLKINIKGTSALPIYVSTSNGPDEAPYVVGPREQGLLKLKKEANEVLSKFNLTKEAEIQTLTPTQIEHKRKLKETRAALLAESNEKKEIVTKQAENEEAVVPKKKARLDSKDNEKPKENANAKAKGKDKVKEKKIKNKPTTKKV